MPGYYRSAQDCVACPDMSVYSLIIFIFALLGAGLLAAWMQRSGMNLKGKEKSSALRPNATFATWHERIYLCDAVDGGTSACH
jgi:hypothetical protein